jgi:hypothetical protein
MMVISHVRNLTPYLRPRLIDGASGGIDDLQVVA